MVSQVTAEEMASQREYIKKISGILSAYDEIPLAHVHSFGCQQNVSDSEKIKGMLGEMGFGFTDKTSNAAFVLYNTCAVRENAEDKVFGIIGELKHNKEQNKDMIIAVCGCMVQQEHIAEKLKKSFPHIDLIFGTHVLHTLPQLIYEKLITKERRISIPNSDGIIAEGLPVIRESNFRASVPIMYGCNNFCTYCIVPYVRGRERSRSEDDIYSEVMTLINDGYKDICLLGQNVNSYGKDKDTNFSLLLRRLDTIEGEYKISFMTSHPKDATKELIDTIAESRHISHHIHLPIQCGSNRILKLMNRGYTVERYIELVQYAKEKIKDISLTSDIIVGFPGEQYADFCETLEFIKKIKFDSLFTFIYSKRSGTKAAEMEDNVSPEEKGKWFRELLDVQRKSGAHSYDGYVGKTIRVLCEGIGRTKDGFLTGKSIQNIIVDFEGDMSLIGQFVDIEITQALNWALIGKLVK